MSSKEQLTGIEQINDAVNQLDQQTQQNAQIASQTHDIAVLTDEIAKLVVIDADTKEFIGKKPKTSYRVTNVGRLAFTSHLNQLEKLLKSTN